MSIVLLTLGPLSSFSGAFGCGRFLSSCQNIFSVFRSVYAKTTKGGRTSHILGPPFYRALRLDSLFILHGIPIKKKNRDLKKYILGDKC